MGEVTIAQEAKEAGRTGLKTYTSRYPCKKGHTERYTWNGICACCTRENYDPTKHKEYMQRYIAKDPVKYKKIISDWHAGNPEKMRSYSKKYTQRLRSEALAKRTVEDSSEKDFY